MPYGLFYCAQGCVCKMSIDSSNDASFFLEYPFFGVHEVSILRNTTYTRKSLLGCEHVGKNGLYSPSESCPGSTTRKRSI